jgi:hypothetical protein
VSRSGWGRTARGLRRVLGDPRTQQLKGALSHVTEWVGRAKLVRAMEKPADNGRPIRDDHIRIDPASIFTPDRATIDARTRFDELDLAKIEWTKGERAFYRHIPYSKFLDQWAFHPGRIGGYLTSAKITPRLLRAARALPEYMTELPNGGLALYYPTAIRTTRFTTEEPLYSGIAQGQLLAGYTRLMREAPESAGQVSWEEIARRLLLSIRFPLERGGVCLDERMILEGPNYRACPESILNGWIDALLHVHDYARVADDAACEEFHLKNIDALVELLPTFDFPDARLSRYSNLCPYVFRVNFATPQKAIPRVRVEYLAATPGFSDFVIPDLWIEQPPPECPYDNAIIRSGPDFVDLAVSISGQFALRLQIDAECSSISFDPGSFDEASTVPARSLKRRFVAPAKAFDGNTTSFYVDPAKHGLIPGCPTNFMKKGRENFYHSYHITSLYELALTTRDFRQRKILTDYASRWLSYMEDPRHRDQGDRFVFADPAMFARSINILRALRQPKTFEELRAAATAF